MRLPLLVKLTENVAESFDATAAADAVHASILGALRSSVERDGFELHRTSASALWAR